MLLCGASETKNVRVSLKKNRPNNNLFQTVVFNTESHSSVKEDTFFKAAQILRNEIASYKEWSFKGPLIVM